MGVSNSKFASNQSSKAKDNPRSPRSPTPRSPYLSARATPPLFQPHVLGARAPVNAIFVRSSFDPRALFPASTSASLFPPQAVHLPSLRLGDAAATLNPSQAPNLSASPATKPSAKSYGCLQ